MKISLYLFIILSILLIADCLAYYKYQISLAGYYSDVALVWLWIFMGLIIIFIFWKKILAKVFLGLLILTLILSVVPLGLPFFTFLLSNTSAGLRINKNMNDNYRGQIVGYGVMTHPWLEVIEKHGLWEKKILECTEMDIERLKKERINVKFDSQLHPEHRISEAKDIHWVKETDSTLSVSLFYGGPNRIFVFDKISKKLLAVNQK